MEDHILCSARLCGNDEKFLLQFEAGIAEVVKSCEAAVFAHLRFSNWTFQVVAVAIHDHSGK